MNGRIGDRRNRKYCDSERRAVRMGNSLWFSFFDFPRWSGLATCMLRGPGFCKAHRPPALCADSCLAGVACQFLVLMVNRPPSGQPTPVQRLVRASFDADSSGHPQSRANESTIQGRPRAGTRGTPFAAGISLLLAAVLALGACARKFDTDTAGVPCQAQRWHRDQVSPRPDALPARDRRPDLRLERQDRGRQDVDGAGSVR